MARLPSVNIFNEERVKAIKIKTIVDDAIMNDYLEQIVVLLTEILDETIQFKEKI